MADASPNDLKLGHFGIPAYDLNDSHWAFARTSRGSGFRQLGQWDIVVPAAVHFPPSRLSQALPDARHATKNFVRDAPELVPARSHIAELEPVSAAASAALSTHDATSGQLMSFGSITLPKIRAAGTRRVVAHPTGEGRNILRLQLLLKERRGWTEAKNSRSCYLEGLSLKDDCGFWNEKATAIQQVCFAQSEDPGSFLAVRLPQRIALFRPVYHQRRIVAAKSPLYNLPPSVLEIRPFHSVRIEDTGTVPHADVSFNPHYQRQFAIIDQDSNWSVWDIEGFRRNYIVKRAVSGSMKTKEDFDSDEQAETVGSWKEDGWARIMWIGDANTILICNRRRLELVDLKQPTHSFNLPQVIDWSSVKNPSQHWILDVKRNPGKEKEFFVLTSNRLYLFSVTSIGDEVPVNSDGADATVIMSWTHFRGTEDVTLQLHVQPILEEETTVFIHSRLNGLVTVYRLVDQPSTAAPYCSFGPTMLRLDNLNSTYGSKLMVNFELTRLNFKNWVNAPRGTAGDYEDRGVQFYQLSAIFDDLSVAQTMLCSLNPAASDQSLQDIEPTSWTKVIRPSTYLTDDLVSRDEDDFIEPDGTMNALGPLLKPVYQLPKPLQTRTIVRVPRNILDFSSLYEALATSNPAETVDILDLVAEIKWRLDRTENVEPFTLGTMQEYAEATATVEDIDEASSKMQELVLSNHASALELQGVASNHVLGFGRESSLSSFYDIVLQNWVASLPSTVPARIRQSKERMARRIATGVVLASTRVRQSEGRMNSRDARSGLSQDSDVVLSSSLPRFSSQPNPRSQSSQPSDPDDIGTLPTSNPSLSGPLARLRQHLHIAESKEPVVQPSISQVLTHWQLGTDPSTYDWEVTERDFVEGIELAGESTRKRREKVRREKEKQAKRQKRENQLFTGRVGVESGVVESQPQMLRSSPGPAFMGVSSQVGAGASAGPGQSQPFVMQSQVEPGKHGGRPAKKKKVKSRMSGF